MARTRDEQSFQEKREQILETAATCFVEFGFHSTGMAKICKAAGMSAGALYRYFPSKEAIIEAIAERDRKIADTFLTQLKDSDNKAISISTLMEQVVLMLAEDRTYCQLSIEISAEAARNRAIAKLIGEIESDIINALTVSIQQGQKAGYMKSDLQPELTAQFLMMMIDGAIGQFAFKQAVDADAIAQYVKQSVLNLLSIEPLK